MASVAYLEGIQRINAGSIDPSVDTLRVALIKASPSGTPDDVDLQFVTDVLGQSTECDFTNYSRLTISNWSAVRDTANDRVEISFDTLTWTSAGGTTDNTVGAVLLFKEITDDNDSPVIYYWDIGDVTTTGGDLEISPGTDGAVHIS